jgi:predicted GNAT family N-acyltransferase
VQYIKVKTDSELKLCLALRQQVFVMEQGVPVEMEIDHYDATPHECIHVLIIDEDGNAAATGRLISYGENIGKLQRIAVREDLRGSGVGRKIVNFLEQEAINSGLHCVVLDAQCSAEQFYAKLGYITLSAEPFLDAGIWHVRMKRDLILGHAR